MLTDEELEALEAQLDPATRIVIGLLRKNNQAQLETIQQLQAQITELRRMLFGRRSEKMVTAQPVISGRALADAVQA